MWMDLLGEHPLVEGADWDDDANDVVIVID